MIKPASGMCNLRCNYCFYHDAIEHREVGYRGFMRKETMDAIVKKAFLEQVKHITFIFQGGEPTLAGIDFFKDFVETVGLYENHIPYSYSIQTNATRLTPEFAKFFKQHHFLVGVSIDGPKKIHNNNRLNHKKVGSFEETMQGLNLLKKFNVDFNILAVITDYSASNVSRIYKFLTNLGTNYLQFIACIDDLNGENNSLSSYNFGVFYKELFDLWYQDYKNGKLVNIQYFDNILRMVFGSHPTSCMLYGRCIVHQVIEANGDVYPCDFYMLDKWKLGNINEESYQTLISSDKAKEFVLSSIEVDKECIDCSYFKLCRGGCRRNKESISEPSVSKTRFCEGIKSFMEYTLDRFIEIANEWSSKT